MDEPSAVRENESAMLDLEIPISGMSGDGCVSAVRSALARHPGVAAARVTIGGAMVSYDPAQTSAEALRREIAQAGYAIGVT